MRKTKGGVTCVIVRLVMLVPDKRYGDKEVPFRLEDTPNFCKKRVRFENMFEHLAYKDALVARVLERETCAVVNQVGVSGRSVARRVYLEAGIGRNVCKECL